MLKNFSHGKFSAVLDAENFRYIIKPLRADGTLSISDALYAIKKVTHSSYAELATFLGLKNANRIFKIIYLSAPRADYVNASKFLSIDVDNQCAYLYDKDHQPAIVEQPHVGPSIINNEPDTQTVTESVPALVTSRINIADVYDRQLTMIITPKGGYVLGISDVNLCSPNVPYQVTGNKRSLNRLLKQIHFVSTEAGNASLDISIDDNAGKVTSKVSTTVTISVTAAAKISIPELTAPSAITATQGVITPVPGISVSDTDGKILELRVAPFGCEVSGFKSLLFPIKEGETRSTGGVPETLNAEIANLQVKPVKLQAFVGLELVYDKTRITKYVPIDVKLPEDETDAEVVAQAEESAVKAVAEEPETQAVPTVKIVSASVSAKSSETVDLGITFEGADDASIEAVLACSGCTVSNLASGANITSGTKRNLIGTLAEINTKIGGAKIVVGDGSGTVTLTYGGKSNVIKVTAKAE